MKYLKYLILLFIFTSFIFIFTSSDEESLEVVSVRHNYVQNVIDNETLRVPLLISKNDSYLTDFTLLEESYLENDSFTIPLYCENIKKEDYLVNYQSKDYFAYMFDYVLNQEELNLNLENSYLKLKYKNGVSHSFYIGDLSLKTGGLDDFEIIYFDSKSEYIDNYYTVTSVDIGLKANKDTVIKSFNLDSNTAYIDNLNIDIRKTVEEIKDYNNSLIYKEKLDNDLNYEISKGEKLYFKLPINYLKKDYLSRFYIEILTNDTNITDDFLFLNQGYFPSFLFEDAITYLIDDQD